MSRGHVRTGGSSKSRGDGRIPLLPGGKSVRPSLDDGDDAREKPLGAAVPEGAGEYIFVRR